MNHSLVLFLSVCACALFARAHREPVAAETRDTILDFDYPTHHTSIHTALLNAVDKDIHKFNESKREKILQLKTNIVNLANQLLTEERKLNKMKANVSSLKNDFFWFFHDETRDRVDEAQMLANDQQRVVENILDDVLLQWKRLKPLYGIYSTMFLTEALGFIPEIWRVCVNIFTTLMELGLISLLMFGSLTGFVLSMFATLGFSFLPAILGFSTLLVNVYWVFQLPFIMIQYSPSFTEFLGVYFAFVGVLLSLTFGIFKLVFPDSTRWKLTPASE